MWFKIIFAILGILFGWAIFILISSAPLEGTKVDCYDNKNNIIIGQTCFVENGFQDESAARLAGVLIGVLIGSSLFILGVILDNSEIMRQQ